MGPSTETTRRDEQVDGGPHTLALWVRWVLAHVLGGAIGGPLGVVVGGAAIMGIDVDSVGANTGMAYVLGAFVAGGAVAGGLVGTMQRFALRRYLSTKGWIPASTLGGGLGLLIGYPAFFASSWFVSDVLYGGREFHSRLSAIPIEAMVGAVVGTCFGMMQWRVLRRQTNGSGWWIAANAFGMAAGLPLGLTFMKHHDAILRMYVEGMTIAAIAGGITGSVLLWLLRSRHEQSGPLVS